MIYMDIHQTLYSAWVATNYNFGVNLHSVCVNQGEMLLLNLSRLHVAEV